MSDYNKTLAFLDLVDQDADELLILGDFAELLWSNMNILSTVKPYRYVNEKLKEIARTKPVKIVCGNHDWNLGLFASLVEPAKVVSSFAENGVYYTHGHREFDLVSFWTGTVVDPIYWQVAFPFVFPWAFPIWLATKVWAKAEDTYNWGIELIHERARDYAIKHGFHTVLFGHTHYPADEVKDGIRLVNCGDQIDSMSYAIEQNGIIELKYF